MLDARRERTSPKVSFEEIREMLGEEVYEDYMLHAKDSILKHLWSLDLTLADHERVGFESALTKDEIRVEG